MPRPKRCRRVCCLPKSCRFGPIDSAEAEGPLVTMTIDEYEAIRIIDLSGLSQEECALQMGVSRTTVQAIYLSARQKLALCLVHGKTLLLSGGSYVLCDGKNSGCGCDCCHKQPKNQKSEE